MIKRKENGESFSNPQEAKRIVSQGEERVL